MEKNLRDAWFVYQNAKPSLRAGMLPTLDAYFGDIPV
jgi:hypothetical protein